MAMQSEDGRWLTQDDFSVTISRSGEESVTVNLAGQFDLSTAPSLLGYLVSPEVADAKRVKIDLTGVTFFDSSSIGLLISACKRVRSTGGAFSVCCAHGIALRVLQISGLVEFFEVEGHIDADSYPAASKFLRAPTR